MRLIFFLPRAITIEEAHAKWCEVEKKRAGGATVTYLNAVHETFRRPSKLSEIIKKCDRATTVILWSAKQVQNWDKLYSSLLRRRFESVRLQILEHDQIFDPAEQRDCEILSMLCDVHSKGGTQKTQKPNEENTPKIFGIPKTDDEIIKKIRDLRLDGFSLRKIAKSLKVSEATVRKYARGYTPRPIPPKIREFNYASLDFVPAESEFMQTLFLFLKHQRTDLTRETYAIEMKKLAKFFHQRYGVWLQRPSDLGEEALQERLEFLQFKKIPSATILKHFNIISSFLTFCLERGIISKNAVRLLQLPIVSRYKIEAEGLAKDEIEKILQHALAVYRSHRDTKKRAIAFRNYLIFQMLSTTGARVSALCHLTKGDIKTKNSKTEIKLNSKKANEKYAVTIDDSSAMLLDRYITLFLKDDPPDTPIFFGRNKAARISTKQINDIIRNVARDLKISKRVSAHSFRVTFATLASESGMKLTEIQKRLNHRDIRQTAAYIEVQKNKPTIDFVPRVPEEFLR